MNGRSYRASKCIFGIAVLLPVIVLTPRVSADPPTWGQDCLGNPMSPQRYAETMQAFTHLDQSFYQGVFAAPFDCCGEVLTLDQEPLVTMLDRYEYGRWIAYEFTMPQVIAGWRHNADGVSEPFTLEVLQYVPSVGQLTLELYADQVDPQTRAILEQRRFVHAILTGILHGPMGTVPVFSQLIAIDADALAGAPAERLSILMPVSVVGWEQIDSTRQTQELIRAVAYGEVPDLAWWEAPGDAPEGFSWPDAADCLDLKNRCDFHCHRALVNCASSGASTVGGGAVVCLLVCGLVAVGGGVGALPCVAACLSADGGLGGYAGWRCWNMARECYDRCGWTYEVCMRSVGGPVAR